VYWSGCCYAAADRTTTTTTMMIVAASRAHMHRIDAEHAQR
jgi:hypothetical protein